MNHSINPTIYAKRYPESKTPYWLVKCQVPSPTPEKPFATKTYQRKHATAASAEIDKNRLMREFGGGSISGKQLKEFETAQQRLETCQGGARGKSISEAIDWFISNYKDVTETPLLEEAVRSFTDSHVVKLRQRSREEYDYYLSLLVLQFGKMQVGAITTEKLQTLVDSYSSKEHHRKCLMGFFAFCSGGSRKIQSPHKWIDENPAKHVVVVTDRKDKEIVILSIDEVKTALSLALLVGDLPYWIWSLFTGMRPDETKKFWTREGYGWDRINLEGGFIIVNSEIAKDGRRRKILIRPVLRAWLEHFRATEEPMFPVNHRKLFPEIKRGAIDDKKFLVSDILRHTNISFRAQFFDKSLATTAAESGNSEKIIKDHYLDLIADEASIVEYWDLTPDKFGLEIPSTAVEVASGEELNKAEEKAA